MRYVFKDGKGFLVNYDDARVTQKVEFSASAERVTRPSLVGGIPADRAFEEWAKGFEEHADDQPRHLCAGARITVDEDGHGTIEIDPELPDGEWIIKQGGKTWRCHGVHGPVKAESDAASVEAFEVSPLDLTYEERGD